MPKTLLSLWEFCVSTKIEPPREKKKILVLVNIKRELLKKFLKDGKPGTFCTFRNMIPSTLHTRRV